GAGGKSFAGASGGQGGGAAGGAIYYNADYAAAPTLTITTSSFSGDIFSAFATGGQGGVGGDAPVIGDSFGIGGSGGNGGLAAGGGLRLASAIVGVGAGNTWTLSADSIIANTATSGSGGTGGPGGSIGGNGGASLSASGGGVSDEFEGTLEILHCSILNN